jgi:hypothetical protein
MAPTTNGVPVAPPLALAPAAAGLVLAAPDAGLAGVLVELDEEEQPAAVSAARARAVSPTPADLPACLRPVELRVIFASFSARAPDRSRAVDLMFTISGTSGFRYKKLND